ncbi:hypothetical protein MAPG_11356 [Magnaporthiopsis poae ATCC 64411]|uniref:Zn(2)-C6 fungal-type domain-containing protein n=1 Tax=Magnaporthiopsis poae (strain ATCC 64411 / 73-15) TaxID=644358 RepID=A0A0C4EF21_MAGP6|nr:hypothetical protein MAPG_11356 [Magnaporthiopsis poae ATCC 64411]
MSESIFVKSGKPARTGTAGLSTTDADLPSSSTPPSKRLACDPCRERKIRCDRQQPACGRCVKVRIGCRYSQRSKPMPSRMDLSRFLVTLNNRLKQAEAQLAMGGGVAENNTQPLGMPWAAGQTVLPPLATGAATAASLSGSSSPPQLSGSSSAIETTVPPWDLSGVVTPEVPPSAGVWGAGGLGAPHDPAAFDFDFAALDPTLPPDAMTNFMSDPGCGGQGGMELDIMCLDMLPTPPAAESSPRATGGAVSEAPVSDLHDHFFDIFHPTMPIINRARLEAELAQTPPAPGVEALSHAIAALGACTVAEHGGRGGRAEFHYERARSLLDECERDGSGTSLASINTLQTCTLLTLYEFKQPNFARSWLTLGRAIRLGKMMGLDQPEDGHSQRNVAASWGLPPTTGEAEERRRTFWALYLLDGFSSLRSNCDPAFDKQVAVPLPGPSDFPKDYHVDEDSSAAATMPSMQQLFSAEIPLETPVSAFVGNTIMIFLYRQYLDHARRPRRKGDDASGAFWDSHYNIEKAITYCRNCLLSHHLGGEIQEQDDDEDGTDSYGRPASSYACSSSSSSSSSRGESPAAGGGGGVSSPASLEPVSLIFRTNLDAVEMSLHEAARLKAEQDDLSPTLAADASAKAMTAAIDVSQALLLSRRLDGKRRETFRQLDRFLIWPLTTAIQTCVRTMGRAACSGRSNRGGSPDERDTSLWLRTLRVLIEGARGIVSHERIAPELLAEAETRIRELGGIVI